ncbi:hypothetical protein Q3G72_014385 [Acer saccharum]|nr:hypothetical protein Q3G72_014385 [Acer saccharum]
MVLGLPPNRVKSTTFSSVTTYHNSSTANLGITKNMVKRSQLGLRHPPSKKKKKNINNGHGDNNNNSNEGEKTKEMVRLPLKGDDGSGGDKDKKGGSGSGDNDGGDKTEGGGGVGGKMGIKTESKGQHDNRNGLPYILRLPPKHCKLTVKTFLLCGRTHNLEVQLKGGDGSGGDKDKKGGSGSGSGDNDGGGKTEGGGGVGGKMGTKTESKGQHDNRNGFSYHAGRADPDILGSRQIICHSLN